MYLTRALLTVALAATTINALPGSGRSGYNKAPTLDVPEDPTSVDEKRSSGDVILGRDSGRSGYNKAPTLDIPEATTSGDERRALNVILRRGGRSGYNKAPTPEDGTEAVTTVDEKRSSEVVYVRKS
ncbi:hypothetical protein N656DRAFT_774342 [Canariomyces notabilis]|uniref:Uncharacterized protein n=1 Tax=Canariomyces notabilis TaxID=2074819 RepID=A0AAN6YX41_9PEZI|nr:hypothetical protein N656DRAFT_774342 [Canariomyces arenarius]